MTQANTTLIQHWSTADVPRASRLDYFAAALSHSIVPFGIDKGDPETFRAEVSFAQLDAIGVCRVTTGSAHRSFRGAGELARTGDHIINLIMVEKAAWTAEHRGRICLSPGDILVHDSEYPFQNDLRAGFSSIGLAVTETWLRRWLPNPSVLVGRCIGGQSSWARALSSYMASLSPELVLAPPLPLAVVADQLGGLLALTASGLTGVTPDKTPAMRSLRERVLDCVLQRCTEPGLTAADVAASVNISLRTLHRALAAAQETFGAKLIDARVGVAQRMLTSPLFNRLTTAEVGRRAGFSNASHFARAVRNRTGRAPQEMRRLQR